MRPTRGPAPAVDLGAEGEAEADGEGEEADDEGVLVDGEDIGPGHVARQEH